jgi:hypothetical protein
MSIRVKNSQLTTDAIQSINNLLDLNINATAAFRLTRIIKELSSIVEDKVKMERRILDKYVEKDESGNPVKPKDENGNEISDSVNILNMDEFTKEMSQLMELENEIGYDPIKFEDLQLETAKVKDLMKIEFLFV